MISKNETVGVGVVGAGFIGQLAHIANYAVLENSRIVALAELRPKLRELVAQRYGINRTYATHHELLEDPEVKAVVVVTARHNTGPIALDCLKAGKHLITEKPIAATLEQSQRLVNAARNKDIYYAVGYMRRYDEGVEKAKSIIDELKVTGELGPIIFARAHCFGGEDYCNIDGYLKTDEKVSGNLPSWSIAPDWLPQQYHQDYAWFLNVYSHNINLLRYLLGETPSVDFVRLDKKNGRVAVLDFDHHVAVLEAGNFSYHSWDEVTEIYFAHGRLKIETPPALLKNVSASIELYKGTSHSTHIYQSGWTWAFRRQAEDFIKCIKGGQIPVTSGDDCLEDMRLIEEMWKMEISRK